MWSGTHGKGENTIPRREPDKGDGVVPEVTDKNMYRYLEVDQVFKANHKAVRAKLTKKFAARVYTIWSSSLSAKRKVQATNIWLMSTFRIKGY